MRATGTILAVSLVVLLGVSVSAASAEPLSMTFTEARANVGVQLSDAALFATPDIAPLQAQIGPAGESIAGGALQVPQFATHITEPITADVTVDFHIGTITGSFIGASGALTLKGTAGGTLTSEGKECTVSTEPTELTLSSAGSSGGSSPRSGVPFTHGLTGTGAIAGQWSDMHAAPIAGDTSFCNSVEDRIEGPGGIWLEQEGDVVAPSAPQLTATDPPSPNFSGTPRILGAAEAGSIVRLYSGSNCAGTPLATGSAAQLSSPGLPVNVAEGATAAFSATATDAADNTSACSAPISYTHGPTPIVHPGAWCTVPKLVGKTLARARAALAAAGCKLSTIQKPKQPKDRKRRVLVVKSSTPRSGARSTDGSVDLRLGPKPRKARH